MKIAILILIKGVRVALFGLHCTRLLKDMVCKQNHNSHVIYYSPIKKMWYCRPGDNKSGNRKPGSMEYIRFKYGGDVIDRQENYELESGNI